MKMSSSARWAIGGIFYILVAQFISLCFQNGIGIYWLVWSAHGGMPDVSVSDGCLLGYPFVWASCGGWLNAMLFAVLLGLFACIGRRVKDAMFLYAGMVVMVAAVIADIFRLPVDLLSTTDVSLCMFIGCMGYTIWTHHLGQLNFALELFCVVLMFSAGTTCMRPYDAQGGAVLWSYWVLIATVCALVLIIRHVGGRMGGPTAAKGAALER